MSAEIIHPSHPRRSVAPAVIERIRRQLDAIDRDEFNAQVQRMTAPLVQAYEDARARSWARMQHKVLR